MHVYIYIYTYIYIDSYILEHDDFAVGLGYYPGLDQSTLNRDVIQKEENQAHNSQVVADSYRSYTRILF